MAMALQAEMILTSVGRYLYDVIQDLDFPTEVHPSVNKHMTKRDIEVMLDLIKDATYQFCEEFKDGLS